MPLAVGSPDASRRSRSISKHGSAIRPQPGGSNHERVDLSRSRKRPVPAACKESRGSGQLLESNPQTQMPGPNHCGNCTSGERTGETESQDRLSPRDNKEKRAREGTRNTQREKPTIAGVACSSKPLDGSARGLGCKTPASPSDNTASSSPRVETNN